MLKIYKLYCIKNRKLYAVPAENSNEAIDKLSKTIGVSKSYIKDAEALKNSLRKNRENTKNVVNTSVKW